MPESHLECFRLQFLKLARRIKTRHRQVIARRPQILPDRQNVATYCGQVAKHIQQFMRLLTDPHHHSRLRRPSGIQLFGIAQQLETPLVPRPRPHHPVQPRHRLRVVVQHLGPRIHHNANCLFVALKIRDQHFNAASGRLPPYLLDHHRKHARPADKIIVAIHARDHRMFEAQRSHRFGHTPRLVEIDRLRPPLGHCAKSASPRTQVAQHHECCRLVMPALADVRALRALAHRVQAQRPGKSFELVIVFAHRRARLQPLRLGRGRLSARTQSAQIPSPAIVTSACDQG